MITPKSEVKFEPHTSIVKNLFIFNRNFKKKLISASLSEVKITLRPLLKAERLTVNETLYVNKFEDN